MKDMSSHFCVHEFLGKYRWCVVHFSSPVCRTIQVTSLTSAQRLGNCHFINGHYVFTHCYCSTQLTPSDEVCMFLFHCGISRTPFGLFSLDETVWATNLWTDTPCLLIAHNKEKATGIIFFLSTPVSLCSGKVHVFSFLPALYRRKASYNDVLLGFASCEEHAQVWKVDYLAFVQ